MNFPIFVQVIQKFVILTFIFCIFTAQLWCFHQKMRYIWRNFHGQLDHFMVWVFFYVMTSSKKAMWCLVDTWQSAVPEESQKIYRVHKVIQTNWTATWNFLNLLCWLRANIIVRAWTIQLGNFPIKARKLA